MWYEYKIIITFAINMLITKSYTIEYKGIIVIEYVPFQALTFNRFTIEEHLIFIQLAKLMGFKYD